MRLAILAGACALALSSNANAAEWWLAAISSDDSDIIFVDRSSVAPVTVAGKRYTKAWRSTHQRQVTQGWKYDMVLSLFDCVGETMGIKSWINYSPAGVSVSSNTVDDYSVKHEPLAPDTTGKAILNFICNAEKGAGETTKFAVDGVNYLYVDDTKEAAERFFSLRPTPGNGTPAPSTRSTPKPNT